MNTVELRMRNQKRIRHKPYKQVVEDMLVRERVRQSKQSDSGRWYSLFDDGPQILNKLGAEYARTWRNMETLKLLLENGRTAEFSVEPNISSDRFLALSLYHNFLYVARNVSGYVKFFFSKKRVFREENDNTLTILVCALPMSEMVSVSSNKIDVKGIKGIVWMLDGDERVIFCLFVVDRLLGESERVKMAALAGEEEVVKTILACGRIAKSMARALVPVVDMHGNVVELTPIGSEELLFSQLLMHSFAEIRRRRAEGEGRHAA